jgi:hypothetical protein
MEQHSDPHDIPLHERAELLVQAERDSELAGYLQTLRMADAARLQNPADEVAAATYQSAEALVANYLKSSSAQPQGPQG